MLRKISLTLNALVVVLSLALLSYTFFAKSHLVEKTRSFVTEKTLSYSKPFVGLMRAGLESPLSKKLILEEHRFQMERELKFYDSDPVEYVTALTSMKSSSFGTGKVAKFKEKVRNYYESTLGALVRDLRIFSGSNVVAGLFAIWLLLNGKLKRNSKVIGFSFIIFAAVAYSVVSYVSGVSFLNVLLKWHLGWWYPVGIAVTVLGMVLEYGLHKETDAERTSEMG